MLQPTSLILWLGTRTAVELFNPSKTLGNLKLVRLHAHICIAQVFVEALDRAFENVCELDLVFHFDEVNDFWCIRVLWVPQAFCSQ